MIKLIMLMLTLPTSLTWAVFGGVAVEAHDPVRQSTVSFGVQGSPVFSCSGTVISEDFVLLAGHCVRSVGSSALEIRFGLDAYDPQVETRPVTGMFLHPDYKSAKESGNFARNDIALVRFEGGLPRGYSAARLPQQSRYVFPDFVVAAGFGLAVQPLPHQVIDTRGTGLLRKVRLKVKSVNYSAKEVYLDQSEQKGVCMNDSGGPAYENDNDQILTVLAIVSRGEDYCDVQSTFEVVSEHFEWIQSFLKK